MGKVKNKLLYALIGLLSMTGLVHTVHATVTWTQPGGANTDTFIVHENYSPATWEYVGAIANAGTPLSTDPQTRTVNTPLNYSGVGFAWECTIAAISTNDCDNNANKTVASSTAIFLNGLLISQTTTYSGASSDTSTHFITTYPTNGTTTATTTYIGAKVYANPDDFGNQGGKIVVYFSQDSAYSCEHGGAILNAVDNCAGENAPAEPFSYEFGTTSVTAMLAGIYDYSNIVTFPGGGQWSATYQVYPQNSFWQNLQSTGLHILSFGLLESGYSIVATTTHFTIGQMSPMDLQRARIAQASLEQASSTRHSMASILASTTASLAIACNPLSGNFNMGDCLLLTIWPGQSALEDDWLIFRETPPLGYAFRVLDILNATTSSTSMPSISYTFATSSPMAVVGAIHFDPFTSIKESATLVNEMKSDRTSHSTIWDIFMPLVKIFVYAVLGLQIIHDLTGIHSGDFSVSTKNMNKRKGKDDSYAYKSKLYEMSQKK